MNDRPILHCYDVYYQDENNILLGNKTKYIRGEITEKDGKYYVDGKYDQSIQYAHRMEYNDKVYRKPIPKKVRQQVYGKFDGRCAYCGKPLAPKELRVDHFIPVCDGGTDDITNLVPSCVDCNTIKGTENTDILRETVDKFQTTIKKDIRYRMLLAYGLIHETPHQIEFLYEKEEKE